MSGYGSNSRERFESARPGCRHRLLLAAAIGCLLVVQGCGTASGDLDDGPPDSMVTASSPPTFSNDRSGTTAVPAGAPATTAAVAAATPSATGDATTTNPTSTAATETTAAEESTLPTNAGLNAAEVLGLVAAHYDALNAGSVLIPGFGPDLNRAVALNARFDAECRIAGEQVVCTEQVIDDFYGPAGFVFENEVAYAANGTEVLPVSHEHTCLAAPGHAYQPRGPLLGYLQAFDRWLYETHPDTLRWIWLFAGEGLPNWLDGLPCQLYSIEGSTPDPRLIDFVREFVDQSDEYPLEPAVVVTGRGVGDD